MEITKALALPDEEQFKSDIKAINRFQQVVRANMVEGQDYGVIPGTTKPTLLKPGAEKIAKLLGLADEYTIEDKVEDWDKPFFRYLIKCRLVSVAHRVVISEGLGECNSLEAKYRWRWVGDRDLPEGIDKTKLISQERRSKTGGKWRVYRLENEDIFSQVNTILKMSKKRALVDAALSAGRLSQVFTQDIEDMSHEVEDMKPTAPPTEIDRVAEDTAGAKPLPETPAPEQPKETPPSAIDDTWLQETLDIIHWKEATALSWIKAQLKVPGKGTLLEVLNTLDADKLKVFVEHIRLMREAA